MCSAVDVVTRCIIRVVSFVHFTRCISCILCVVPEIEVTIKTVYVLLMIYELYSHNKLFLFYFYCQNVFYIYVL